MIKGLFHYVGTWIVFVPLVGDYIELVEQTSNVSYGEVMAKRLNYKLLSY